MSAWGAGGDIVDGVYVVSVPTEREWICCKERRFLTAAIKGDSDSNILLILPSSVFPLVTVNLNNVR